jgi:signal transduction histidine kinase
VRCGCGCEARIFDRFRRGTTAYRTYRGSGLGLSIVRAIAEAHGGRVELVSRPGAGSTFTLVLPAERARRDPDTSSDKNSLTFP